MSEANEVDPVVGAMQCAEPGAAVPPTRQQIERLQSALLAVRCDMPEAVHHFARGMYVREFSMPAGMVVVGKRHRHQHIVMVLRGHARIVTEHGVDDVHAGFIGVSEPGAKRVVLAFQDTTFATVHLNPDDGRDLEAIETEHIEPESEEFQALMQAMQCKEITS